MYLSLTEYEENKTKVDFTYERFSKNNIFWMIYAILTNGQWIITSGNFFDNVAQKVLFLAHLWFFSTFLFYIYVNTLTTTLKTFSIF